MLGTRILTLTMVAVTALASVAAPAPAGAVGGDPQAPFRQLSAGGSHTCAILTDGSVKCWGLNDHGQLGLGDTANRGDGPGEMGDDLPVVALGVGRTAVQISAGTNHTCALLDNGSVKCWGMNQSGELGIGDNSSRGDGPGEMGDDLPAVALGTGRTAVSVTAAQNYTCARLDNASVKCWGSNVAGKLGLGDTANRGDGPGEMGDDLPTVALGTGRTALAVAPGGFHVCVLLDNASVKCWGAGGAGALGLENITTRGDNPNEMGDDLPTVNLGTGRTATAITTGTDHTCALLDNASLKCWGQGNLGQTGLGINTQWGSSPGSMGDNLPTVNLGTGRTAVAVSTRFNHTCAMLDNASVKCWGWNVAGQLGLGDTGDRGDGPNEMGDNLPAVALGTGRTAVAVTTGVAHTCARLDDGTVKCWGFNQTGQLGQGDTTIRGDGPGEMGDDLPVVQVVTPAPAMTVGLTADEATVPVGSPIHYHVTLTNTGNVPLTGITVTDPDAPGCAGPQTDLGVGAAVTVDCTYTPTVDDIGTHTRSATADGTEISPVTSDTVDVAVTIPDGQALLKGQVTAVIFGNPISGTLVAALDPGDFRAVGLDTTAADGTYAMLVPADSAMIYLTDPAGGHIAKFHQTTPTALADGATVVVNSQLNRARGGIEGRMTDSASGDGVATGLAVTTNALTGQVSNASVTDGFGFWVVRGLRSVSHWVVLLDLAGGHRATYHRDSAGPDAATSVDVIGDALQVIGSVAVPAQTAPTGTAHVQGTITDSEGAPLGGAAAVVLRASTMQFVAGDLADGSGAYDVPVDPGSYLVGFLDPAGAHTFEWHADQPASGLGSATAVSADVGSAAMVDASLAPTTGTVEGTVTEDGSGSPLQDVWVFGIDTTGSVVAVDRTAADGTYTLSSVPAGGLRVRFYDLTGDHLSEYHDNQPGTSGEGYGAANVITVTGGATSTIDAGLAPTS